MIRVLFCLFAAYLIGSVSGSYILGKVVMGMDIRNHGSGNAGTTNALRSMGKKLALATFIVDFTKGFLVMTLLSPYIREDYYLILGVFAVVGHDYPFYMSFKGGKGMATTAGCLMWVNPLLASTSMLIGVAVALLSRYVSLGSMFFLAGSSLLFYFCLDLSLANQISIAALAILGLYRHRSNIARLLAGKENKIGGF